MGAHQASFPTSSVTDDDLKREEPITLNVALLYLATIKPSQAMILTNLRRIWEAKVSL
jgi:hypothetical protein